MRARLTLVAMGLFTLTILAFSSSAQPPRGSTPEGKDEIITNEQQLARQFADFQDALLRLKQRLARGTPEERKRAAVLDKVLDECKNLAVNQEFTKMIEVLRLARINNTDDLEKLKNQSDGIAKSLRKILDMMQASKADLSADRKKLEDIIKALDRAINKQKQIQGVTDLGKTDPDELKQNQNAVTKETAKVAQAIDKYLDKDNKNQGADLKGKFKDGGKGDGKQGEAKDAGKKPGEGQKAEAKGAGKDAKPGQQGQAKAGDNKSGQPGEKAPSQAKSGSKTGDKSGKNPQQAGAKGKTGDPKKDNPQSAAKGNPSDKKDQQAGAKGAGDPKQGSPKGSAKADSGKKSGKPGGGESSPSSQAKAGPRDTSKEGGAKPAQGDKGGQAKAGGDPSQGDAKAGDSKDGQGQAKGGGSPAQGGGGQQGQQASQKGDGSPPSQSPPSASKQDQDVAKSGKKIQEAGYDQKSAEDNIKKANNAQASKQQGDAIDKMEAAKKKLEKLLQQMREEEIERVLAALQARCEKMLMMQTQVLAGTEDTEKVIQRNSDKKPTRENKFEALKLSDKERDIVQECNKCIDILEAEGSAVAFPEVFQQIRQDMIHVQKRLELTDVADQTQGIERDIIDTLKEMIAALKKARQDNQSDPSKSQPGQPGKPGDQKLLELIQELKMVRSLQKRVNDRTTDYGKRYKGEQANDVAVIRNLRQLAERQQRIQEIVSRISKGDNK